MAFFTDYSMTIDETISLVASTTLAPENCVPCQELAVDTPVKTIRWHGIIGVEGELTGDGRFIQPGALRWETMPIPLRYDICRSRCSFRCRGRGSYRQDRTG